MPNKQLKLSTAQLVLETTRRCNMVCPHCLRGEAESLDMPAQLIWNLFAGLGSVQELVFSGGEPSLVPHLANTALFAAEKSGTSVSGVYVTTNAKTVPDEFLQALTKWHVKCLADATGFGRSQGLDAAYAKILVDAHNSIEEPIGLHVQVSMDEFHEDIPAGNLIKLCTLPHVGTNKYRKPGTDDWVLKAGRAEFNGLGSDAMPSCRSYYFGEDARKAGIMVFKDTGTIELDSMLYVSATGRLFKYCDFSYDQMDETDDYLIGTIDTEKPDPGWAARLYEQHKDDY